MKARARMRGEQSQFGPVRSPCWMRKTEANEGLKKKKKENKRPRPTSEPEQELLRSKVSFLHHFQGFKTVQTSARGSPRDGWANGQQKSKAVSEGTMVLLAKLCPVPTFRGSSIRTQPSPQTGRRGKLQRAFIFAKREHTTICPRMSRTKALPEPGS